MSGIKPNSIAPISGATLIAGPTASGKSAMALDLARRTGGVIVNADSMQVYGVLNVLTARPDHDTLAEARHELYGHVEPARAYSVAAWLADVSRLAETGIFQSRPAIFVGGTGLYFTALTQGLSQMPPISHEIRDRWRGRLEAEGAPVLHKLLRQRDAAVAARLDPSDGQRIVRALEVLDASGRSIADWQERRGPALVDLETTDMMVLEPDRDLLAQAIDARFEAMLAQGALDEVSALRGLALDPSLPATKAIGVRELGDYLDGECSIDEASRRAKAATRQYAKRQMTWFRNQFDEGWRRISVNSPKG